MSLPRFNGVKKLEGSGQSFENYLKQINLLYPNLPELYTKYNDMVVTFLTDQMQRIADDPEIYDYTNLPNAFNDIIKTYLENEQKTTTSIIYNGEPITIEQFYYAVYVQNLLQAAIYPFLNEEGTGLINDFYSLFNLEVVTIYYMLLNTGLMAGKAIHDTDPEYLKTLYDYDFMKQMAIEIFEIDVGGVSV